MEKSRIYVGLSIAQMVFTVLSGLTTIAISAFVFHDGHHPSGVLGVLLGLLMFACIPLFLWPAYKKNLDQHRASNLSKAAPASAAPPAPVLVPMEFNIDTYWNPLLVDGDLSAEAFRATVEGQAKNLWKNPLIVIRDPALRRLIVLRNNQVPWVKAIRWEKLEIELTIAEILGRVRRWASTWHDQFHPCKATADALQEAVACQSGEALVQWLDGFLRGKIVDNKPVVGIPPHLTVLEQLTGSPSERVKGRERVCSALLRHKPGCIRVEIKDDKLPSGLEWKEVAGLEQIILKLPAPGWIGLLSGYAALLFDDSDLVGGDGTVLTEEEIDTILTEQFDEASCKMAGAVEDIRRAVFNSEMLQMGIGASVVQPQPLA